MSTDDPKHRADETQLTNGRRLAAIVESASDAIIAKTLDGQITCWNRGAERLYGYTAEEAIGQHISIIVPEEKREELNDIFGLLKRGEMVEAIETNRRTKDGRLVDVSLTVSPIRNDTGSVVGASAIARDVTIRKREEKYLATEHAISRVLVDASSFVEAAPKVLEIVTRSLNFEMGEFWTRDELRDVLRRLDSTLIQPTPTLKTFDKRRRALTFAPGEGVPGRVWQSGTSVWITEIADNAQFVSKKIAKAAGVRTAVAFPINTGEEFHGVMSFFSKRTVESDPVLLKMMDALATDIGLYIRHMRANAENANLAAIVESSNDAIFGWSNREVITSWNRRAERLFGKSADDMIGGSVYRIIPEGQVKRARRLIKKLIRDGHGGVLDEISVHTGERNVRLSLTFSPISDHTGASIGFSTIARDVTIERETAEALRRAKDDAERANRAKSEFLATMSHEIRTPLNGVLATAELLLATNPLPAQRDYAETIRESGEQLVHLLNDILDLSKIEAGRLELAEREFDLKELLDNVATAWEARSRKKGLEFFVTIQPGLPLMLIGDDSRIRQVLENLISNAFKYTERGYVAVRATADSTDTGESLRLEVKDTGAGISAETQSELFSRFTRGQKKGEKGPEGTGLGLAICREIVDLMGGEIGVESEKGSGSTFWITVPTKHLERRRKRGARPIRQDVILADKLRAQSSLRILVVDDNATNRKLLVDILSLAGHAIDTASDGTEAVAAVQRFRYDIIFMDIRMPEMDGVVATSKIRSLAPSAHSVPIIAVTANAMRRDRQKYLDAGMNDYVAKPFSMHDVLAAVTRVTKEQPPSPLVN